MNYFEIVKLIMNIIFSAFSIILAHFLLFAVMGVFFKKTFPKTEKINKYGLIIPARNEEKVVAGLIESIQKNNYPQDKLHIFVIAHNCTDKTAEIARSLGATVYEYENPEENTMGYAFRHLFECIERDFGTQNFDGFFMFNADNILDINYISKMNDAFEFYGRDSVITSYRNSKNFGTNLISGLYGMYFAVGCRLESCGRTVLGCSTRVQGTGYLINSNIVKNGWPYVSLTEDWEFTVDQILYNSNIRYCDAAMFYDEQPVSVKIMWRQRVRWSRGHLLIFYARFTDLFKHIFKKETKHRVSIYDITTNILPSPLFMVWLQFIQILLFSITPLIDKNISLLDVFIGNDINPLFSTGFLFNLLRSAAFSYATMMLMAVVVFIKDRNRIKGVNPIMKILITFLWPLFLLIQLPIDVQAFFSKNLTWKPIPHEDNTSFNQVNDIKVTKQ